MPEQAPEHAPPARVRKGLQQAPEARPGTRRGRSQGAAGLVPHLQAPPFPSHQARALKAEVTLGVFHDPSDDLIEEAARMLGGSFAIYSRTNPKPDRPLKKLNPEGKRKWGLYLRSAPEADKREWNLVLSVEGLRALSHNDWSTTSSWVGTAATRTT